jgi:hypothetical protein
MADEVVIVVLCPACDERITLTPARRKAGVKCPACGTPVPAPKPDAEPEGGSKAKPKKKPREPSSAEGTVRPGSKPRPWRGDDEDPDDRSGGAASAQWEQAQTIGCAAAVVVGLVIIIGLVVWGIVRSGGSATTAPAAPGAPNDPALAPPFEVDPLLERPDRPVYLADMSEFGVVSGPWPFTKGGLGNPTGPQPTGDPIKVNGTEALKGLSMHPGDNQTTRAAFALGGRASELRGTVALNDDPGDAFSPVVFAVVGDGRELWRSVPINRARGPESFRVDVRGVQVLELRVTAQGSHFRAHAVWVDPVITK